MKPNINFIVEHLLNAVRNSEIENLHAGIGPSSKTGDYSDVKVVSPYGEIPWNELSRFGDKEMGVLKDSFRKEMKDKLNFLIESGLEFRVIENTPLSRITKEFDLMNFKSQYDKD